MAASEFWAEEAIVSDISLVDYIAVRDKSAKYLPHSAGRYQIKRFRKATCPVVERLASSMMMHGRNNGKKLMTVRIVKHAFEIMHLLTGENPVQILVNAVINSGPREDSTRIGVPEPCDAKLWTFRLFVALIRQSGSCVPVLVRLLSETSKQWLNAWRMN
uniref:Ribosomal protein S7 domain-containing protein n=1 Tax=Ditylenchus dipsaci TaxID=166011 RepID=A0A915D8C9_9BILA